MRRGLALALVALAALGCQSSGTSSSWRWPWSKPAAREPLAARGRSYEADAEAIYGGRDPLLSANPPPSSRNRIGLDEPPLAPAAASNKKPFFSFGAPRS